MYNTKLHSKADRGDDEEPTKIWKWRRLGIKWPGGELAPGKRRSFCNCFFGFSEM